MEISGLKMNCVATSPKLAGRIVTFHRLCKFLPFVQPTAITLPVLIGLAIAPGNLAQSQSESAAFDVVSIKRNSSERNPNSNGELFSGKPLGPPVGGRLRVENVSLRFLIRNAYGLQAFQVVGGPEWIDSIGYDLNVQFAGSGSLRDRSYTAPAQETIRVLLRKFLEDRVKLRVHPEVRQMPGHRLLAKGSLHPAEPRPGNCVTGDTIKMPQRDDLPLPPCGVAVFSVVESGGTVKMHAQDGRGGRMGEGTRVTTHGPMVGWLEGGAVSMNDVASTLSGILGGPVINETGFTPKFDVHLEFSLGEEVRAAVPGVYDIYHYIFEYSNEKRQHPPSLPDALSGFGLVLEAKPSSAEVLVVENVEKPSGR